MEKAKIGKQRTECKRKEKITSYSKLGKFIVALLIFDTNVEREVVKNNNHKQ